MHVLFATLGKSGSTSSPSFPSTLFFCLKCTSPCRSSSAFASFVHDVYPNTFQVFSIATPPKKSTKEVLPNDPFLRHFSHLRTFWIQGFLFCHSAWSSIWVIFSGHGWKKQFGSCRKQSWVWKFRFSMFSYCIYWPTGARWSIGPIRVFEATKILKVSDDMRNLPKGNWNCLLMIEKFLGLGWEWFISEHVWG